MGSRAVLFSIAISVTARAGFLDEFFPDALPKATVGDEAATFGRMSMRAGSEIYIKESREFMFSKITDDRILKQRDTIFVGPSSGASVRLKEFLGGGEIQIGENTIITFSTTGRARTPTLVVVEGSMKLKPSAVKNPSSRRRPAKFYIAAADKAVVASEDLIDLDVVVREGMSEMKTNIPVVSRDQVEDGPPRAPASRDFPPVPQSDPVQESKEVTAPPARPARPKKRHVNFGLKRRPASRASEWAEFSVQRMFLSFKLGMAARQSRSESADSETGEALSLGIEGEFIVNAKWALESRVDLDLSLLSTSNGPKPRYLHAEGGAKARLFSAGNSADISALAGLSYQTTTSRMGSLGYHDIYGPYVGAELGRNFSAGSRFAWRTEFGPLESGVSFYPAASFRLQTGVMFLASPARRFWGSLMQPVCGLEFSWLRLSTTVGSASFTKAGLNAGIKF